MPARSTSSAPRRERFQADIEGLRGVAILAVVLYHCGLLHGGFVGVDVFFVLSGFLITRLLWHEMRATGRVSFASFYARRARRLLPASILVIVATVIMSVHWLAPLAARSVLHDARAASLYVANYRFAAQRTNYLATSAPSPLQHYWSLAVEEQFYAVWPLLMLGAFRLAHRSRQRNGPAVAKLLAVVGFVSFLWCWRLTSTSQPWAFFSLPTRAWELVVGALVGLGARRLRRLRPSVAVWLGWLGLTAVGWSVVRFSSATAFPGVAALLPVVGTATVLVAGCAHPARGPHVLLERKPLQFCGHVSYAWYLWHWPVLVLAPIALGVEIGHAGNVALAALSLGLAVLTTEFVERPIRFSPRLAAQPRPSLAIGAALTAVGVFATVGAATAVPSLQGHGTATVLLPRAGALRASSRSAPAAVDPVSAEIVAAVHERVVPANLDPSLGHAAQDKAAPFLDGCDNTFTDATVHRCTYANASSGTTVMLFGDSHAAQYFPAFDLIAQTRGWRLVVLTKATCPPFEVQLFSPVLGRNFRECEQWREAALARIANEHPAIVVMAVARHYGPEYHFHVFGPEWLAGLRDTVARVHADGIPVMLLSPTPKPPWDVPTCLSDHLDEATACAPPRSQAIDAAGLAAERLATTEAGGTYVDVTPWACASTICPAIVGNNLAYRDDNHFTTTFARWLATPLASSLDRVLDARTASAS
jgi:peptidoglycan/LPS O-acetylase OafA/YrhL